MNKTYKILILLAIIFAFTSCARNESSIDSDEIKSLQLKNKMLNNELEKLEEERDYLKKYMDNSREMEITNTSIYRIRNDYFEGSNTSVLKERIIETNKRDFFLEKENLYNFKVSNDNELIAVLIFDRENVSEQYVILYSHEGKKLYEYELNDFLDKADNPKYLRDNLISFHGFSKNNKYLWGGLPEDLEISVFFSIEIETGQIRIYNFDNYNEYEKLLEKHPYNS